jgi:mevalonate kinase
VRSDVPLGGGLGSSAALGVALARAAAEATGRLLEPDEAAQHALLLERVFHGAPSGVDPAVSANEGVILFTRALDERPAQLSQVWPNKPVHLVIAPTGIVRGTRSTVMPMADRRAQRPRLFDPLLTFLGELARGGKDALERGDVDDLGVRFDAAHGVLAALGVSCPELDALVVALRRAGAVGAKLTGAGGGGAAIALAREAEHAARIAERIGDGAFTTVVS